MCSVNSPYTNDNNLFPCYQKKNICAHIQLELEKELERESQEEIAHGISDLLVDVCDNRLYILYKGLTMSLSFVH